MNAYFVISFLRFGKGPRQTITRKMVVLALTEESAQSMALSHAEPGAAVTHCEKLAEGSVTTITIG
jgi:hypothetical protein